MKKYLMTGMAAIAFCAAFTSCSKNDDLYDPSLIEKMNEEAVNQKYAEAFESAFGKVGPNVDWGFGSRANTRALNMAAGANKNRNQWAATDGQFKLLVPTPLSDDQRDRVRAYFQQNRYLTWQQPDMTDYFVQQVYTGGTKTTGSLSQEIYTKAVGDPVTGGQHMDYLTIAGEHVLDFNAANNVNTATDVKNNNTKMNDTQYHSDQITLMIGITPTNVGYKVSDGSVTHIDHMALVSAKEIDDWARKEENFVNGKAIGEDVWYGTDKDGYANSFWKRSFVGLDYEQQPASDAFTGTYVKVDEIQPGYIWDSATNTTLSKAEYKAQYNTEYLLDKNGNKIPWLVTNTNEFLAQSSDFPSQESYMPRREIRTGYTDQVLDIQLIYAKVAANCYPVSTKQLQEWKTNVGGRDYYYSDWIVTLAPAQQIEIDDTPTYRVIAEDLNADDPTDFDFNDVVFDVEPNEAGTAANIILQACGGIYKLTVAGVEVHDAYGYGPDADGLYPMINTGDGPSGLGPRTIVENYEGDFSSDANIRATIKSIPIKVWKPSGNDKTVTEFILSANYGQPASKVLVDKDFGIVPEHQSIATSYGNFTSYVRGAWEDEFWWK